MNLTNKKVNHRQFGDGTVTEQTPSTVTVQFPKKYGEKRFVYPSAFESFLTLKSKVQKEKMDTELLEIKERAEEERKRSEQEAKQRREDENLALLEQKQANTKKRSSAKKALTKQKTVK